MDYGSFGILGALSEAFSKVSGFFSDLWNTLYVKTIGDLLDEAGLLGDIADWVLPDSVFEQSLGWLILGAGLAVYLVYQLATWILNLIT